MPTQSQTNQTQQRGDVTCLLEEIDQGHEYARAELLKVAYDELRLLAHRLMNSERAGHTLQPTALVNEAALRLLGGQVLALQNRAHFFGAMANGMRRILVDHARARLSHKRGGGRQRESLDVALAQVEAAARSGLLELEEVLAQLEQLDPRQYEIVVRRIYGGFELKEIAEQLDVSLSTVEKDWRMARAYLRSQLEVEGHAA